MTSKHFLQALSFLLYTSGAALTASARLVAQAAQDPPEHTLTDEAFDRLVADLNHPAGKDRT